MGKAGETAKNKDSALIMGLNLCYNVFRAGESAAKAPGCPQILRKAEAA